MPRIEKVMLMVCDGCGTTDSNYRGTRICFICRGEMTPAEFIRTPPEEYAPDYDKVLDDLRKKQAGGE